MIRNPNLIRRADALNPQIRAEADLLVMAYKSVYCPPEGMAYASMAITTGARYYEVLEANGCRTVDELNQKDPKALVRDIIVPNVADGRRFAEETVNHRTVLPMLCPAEINAGKLGWGEEAYMYVYLTLFETGRIAEVHMSPEWEYSNGGSEEFVTACVMQGGFFGRENVLILNADGCQMTAPEGRDLLTRSISDLSARGFDAPTLTSVVRWLDDVSASFLNK